MKNKIKKVEAIKLSRIENAILYLARLMEDPMHDQYKVTTGVLELLGYEPLIPKRRK